MFTKSSPQELTVRIPWIVCVGLTLPVVAIVIFTWGRTDWFSKNVNTFWNAINI